MSDETTVIEPVEQIDAEVVTTDEVVTPMEGRDPVKDFKDLTRYMLDKEWRNIHLGLKKSIGLGEQAILEKGRGDTELKYSPHDVLFRRCDLYDDILKRVTSPKAEAYREWLVKEINAMCSQIIYKLVDGMGNSLDTPIYSATDMQRHDLKAFLMLQNSLENLVNFLDPQRKATKNTMNPYDKEYTNKVEEGEGE